MRFLSRRTHVVNSYSLQETFFVRQFQRNALRAAFDSWSLVSSQCSRSRSEVTPKSPNSNVPHVGHVYLQVVESLSGTASTAE